MRVSVVIPCYDAARWIGEALRSAAAQTHAPHEIIVVDDGSTDGSRAAIEASGVRVRLLETRRAGGGGARNAGIRAATGDHVAFLDADDVWYPDHLSRAAALLEGEVAYLATYDRLGADGAVRNLPRPWPIEAPARSLGVADFLRLFRGHQFFALCALVVRRERLLEVGLFDEALVRRQDFELFLRVIDGRTWSFDPRPAFAYRETPGSLSTNRPGRERDFLVALLKHGERLDSDDMRALIRLGARRAMSHAYSFGDAADRRAAEAIALPHLAPADRALFAAASLFPPLFGLINRTRQRFTGPLPPP